MALEPNASWRDVLKVALICWIGLPLVSFVVAFAFFSLPGIHRAPEFITMFGSYAAIIAASFFVSWLPLLLMAPVVWWLSRVDLRSPLLGAAIGAGVGALFGFALMGSVFVQAGALVGAAYGGLHFLVLRRILARSPHK